MHLYFTDHDSPITSGASNWEMDDEIYYDMDILPEARILAAAYTPKAAGTRNAGFQRRADELTGRGKRVGIYDIQPQMWTYEKTSRQHTVSRLRVDPGSFVRELQPHELPGDPAAGHCLGGQARQRGRARQEGRVGRCASLRGRRTNASLQVGGKARSPSGLQPDARRSGAADCQGDEHRLGRARQTVGVRDAGIPERPSRADDCGVEGLRIAAARTTAARSRGHDLDPLRHERRRRHGSQARVRRQARARHRLRASTNPASSRRPHQTSGISRTPTAIRSPTSGRGCTRDLAPSTRMR